MNKMMKYKWLTIVAWVGIAVALLIFTPGLSTLVSNESTSSIPGDYPSEVAEKMLQTVKVADNEENQIEVALVFHSDGGLTEGQLQEAQQAIFLLEEEKGSLGIERVLTHFTNEQYTSMLVSEEGESVLAMITLDENERSATAIAEQLTKFTQSADVDHYYTNSMMIEEAFSQQVTSKVTKVLLIGFGILLFALMLFYRSIVTPIVLFISIGLSILVADRLYSVIAHSFSLPVNMYSFYLLFSITMAAGVLFANLLMRKVKSYVLTYGSLQDIKTQYFYSTFKSIFISGVALAIAFSTVLWSEFLFFQTLAVASAGILIITLVSLTFTPALAAIFGRHLFWPFMNPASSMSPFTQTSGFANKRPILILLVTLLVISPILWTSERVFSYNPLVGASDELLPIKGFNVISETFGPGKSVPIEIMVQNNEPMDNLQYLTLIEQLSRQINQLPGVKEVRSASRPFGTEIEDFLVLNQVDTLAEGLGKAIDGVDQISGGLAGAITSIEGSSPQLQEAEAGVSQLITGTDQLQSGVTELGVGVGKIATGLQDGAKGAGDLKTGADKAASSTNELVSGSKELYAGYQQVGNGMTPLKDGVDKMKSGVSQLQSEGIGGLETGVSQLMQGVSNLSTGVGALKTGAGGVSAGIDAVKGAVEQNVTGISDGLSGLDQLLNGIAATNPGIEGNEYFQQAKGTVSQLQKGSTDLKAGLHGGLDNVKAGVGQLSGGINEVDAGLGQVNGGLGQLSGGIDQVGTGLSGLTGGLDQVDGGLTQLDSGVKKANQNFGKVITGQEQLATGLGTLSGGLGELKTGIGQASNGQQQVLANIPNLSDGLGQLGGGHLQLQEGFISIGGSMGELGSGLGGGVDGLSQVSTGLTDALDYLQNLAKSPNSQAAGWFIPDEIITSEMFEQVFDTYLSNDRKVFTMEVVLEEDAFSKGAISIKEDIQTIIKNNSYGTPLESAVASIGGKTSVSADIAGLAEKEFIPTILILLLVLGLALMVLTKSIMIAIGSTLTTAAVSFLSFAIAQFVFKTIVWGVPMYVFMIMVAMITIATISYMVTLQDDDVLGTTLDQDAFGSSLTMLAIGLFTIALLFSGVVALQQGATIVLLSTLILALFIIPIWLPAMSRLFGISHQEMKKNSSISQM